MTRNPFDDPGEQDRTVIRPMPGGVRPATRSAAPAPEPAAAPQTGTELAATGDGPLAVSAAPLLQLLARLRNTATAPDPGDMRERTRRELRAFERRAREAGVPMDQMRLAHYALCATLDDVVLNTPWGTGGRWRDEPLARSLHQDDHAGHGFFDQLRTMRAGLPATLPVLRLMYLCLSLGMAGPYRETPDGLQQLERVRHQVFGLIRPAGEGAVALSASVSGVRLPQPARVHVPVWVAAASALGVVAAVFVGCLTSLNAASDSFYTRALAAPPDAMPSLVRPARTPPPLPPPPTADAASRLRLALSDLAGVEIISSPASAVVRVAAATLFTQGATLAPGPVLDRIGRAVAAEPGAIRVLAYADAQVPRSVAFPSTFALTNARAEAVRAALARTVDEPGRLVAEGRAEADPLAPKPPRSRREQRNNRIEIVLQPGGVSGTP